MPEEQSFTPPGPLHTPVLFLVYKRPDTTRRVFEAIRQAKPPRLYVAADGPKADVPGEAEKVQLVRDIVLSGVDWDCDVKTLFRDTNLGCKYGVSGGIDWFFEHEEEGIILEDDTLPSQSFFWFCQELLERYRDDLRVGQICGHNRGKSFLPKSFDYFYSKYPLIWGWATWKNRWEMYDLEMVAWKQEKHYNHLEAIFSKEECRLRKNIFDKVSEGFIDTWDYQWSYCLYKNMHHSIIPNKNLIVNVGFGCQATHTKCKNNYNEFPKEDFGFPLTHPKFFVQNIKFDKTFAPKSRITAVMSKIKNRVF